MLSRQCHSVVTLAVAVLATGCGGGAATNFDEAALLDEYNVQGRRHDPVEFVEVDMGDFFITRRLPDTKDMLYVSCHLYAVTPQEESGFVEFTLMERKTRMRDTVMSVVQKAEIDALTEPSLTWIKSEMIPEVNRTLRTRSVRDIVFSTYSLQRG